MPLTGHGAVRFTDRDAPPKTSRSSSRMTTPSSAAGSACCSRRGRAAVVAEAGDADDAVRLTKAHRPHVLVLDLNMPGARVGLDAIPEIERAVAGTRVVVLTMQNDPHSPARRSARARGVRPQGGGRRRARRGGARGRRGRSTSTRGSAPRSPRRRRSRGPAGRSDRARGRDPAPDRARPHDAEIGEQLFLWCAPSSRTGRTSSRSCGARRGPSWCATRSTAACSKTPENQPLLCG